MRGFRYAALGVVLLGLMSVVGGFAGAVSGVHPGGSKAEGVGLKVAGAGPVPPLPEQNPSPSTGPAIEAHAAATNLKTTAYVEVYSYTISADLYKTANKSIELLNYTNRTLSPYTSKFTLESASTSVNGTSTCGGSFASCGFKLTCGAGSTPVSFPYISIGPMWVFQAGCSDLWLNWTKAGTAVQSPPEISVSRALTVLTNETFRWGAAGTSVVASPSVTWVQLPAFYAGTTTQAGPSSVTWVVPYPSGNWIDSKTIFMSTDSGAVYGSSYYYQTTTTFLVTWIQDLTYTANVTYHYQFDLYVSSGNASSGNSTGGNGAPKNGGLPYSTVVLVLGNLTSAVGNGSEQASAEWQNGQNSNFTGSYYLEGSWLSTATGVRVYVNGQPIPPASYSVTSTVITIFAGTVTVVTHEMASFVVTFTPNPAVNFYGAVLYLGLYGVTVWNVIGLGGIAAGIGAAWWELREPDRSELSQTLVGIFTFSLFAIALVTL